MTTELSTRGVVSSPRQRKQALLGGACVVGVAAALTLGTAPAVAKSPFKSKQARAERFDKDLFGTIPKGPLQIFISLNNEELRLYRDGDLLASAPVSTGVPGHPTPLGVFDVIQRDRFHHSNIYSNAPMPFMQRITWSGVALHEGEGVGHPASHGCIRMPHQFAARLWTMPTLGMRVVITRSPLAPADIADPRLFVHKTEAEISAATLAQPVKTAQSTDGSKTDASAASVSSRPADPPPSTAPATTAVDSPTAGPDANGSVAATAPRAADPPVSAPAIASTSAPGPAGPVAAVATSSSPPVSALPAGATPVADQATALPAANPAKATPAVGSASSPLSAPQTAPDTLRGTDATQGVPLVAPAGTVPVPLAKPPALAESASASHAPISIFVSRKTMRIYVRQHFAPLFDAPITIADPQQPLGTHVFSALDYLSDGATFRWNVVSLPGETRKTVRVIERDRRFDGYGYGGARRIERTEQVLEPGPPPQTPQQALARIEIPQDVIDRISELMVPGSSLIVSDQGLGPETGEGTDFIVVSR